MNGTQHRVVLVDFDGVVLTNKRCMSFVHHRATDYVMHVTGINTRRLAVEYNKRLCMAHGHTCVGLRKDGFDVGLVDFNRFVYGKIPGDLRMSAAEREAWVSFNGECARRGHDVRLFSNACTSWIRRFLDGHDGDGDMFELQELITSADALKPNAWIYDAVSRKYGGDIEKVFVDDNLTNFAPETSGWTNFWLSAASAEAIGESTKKNVILCRSLECVINRLHEFDAARRFNPLVKERSSP